MNELNRNAGLPVTYVQHTDASRWPADSSCTPREPPPSSTGCCTTPTSAKPAATAFASPKHSPAKGWRHWP